MNDLPTFGPYHLFERVSVGGMAEVFKAMEYGADGFEREVAVKRILPHVAEDEEFITMFKDEAHIAVQLKHGNIAQIYNLGFENDTFYIALEFVSGKDARTIFERCRQTGASLPIPQACFIVMQVCEGLDYAHNKKDKYGRPLNIIHRDVSPPNILVSYEGEVKLIDFGVAKAAGRASHTQSGILKGKFGYMSPEQVKGRALDRRSDVFAIGVVLWELLTGRRLFQGDTDFATLEKVRSVDISPPSAINSAVNPKLEAIVLKALAAEPDDRYQSAMELHDALQAFMFEDGMFASRKDLAAYMRQTFATELEQEKEKAAKRPPPARGAAAGRPNRSTMMMGPGQMPGLAGGPPPPPGASRSRPPAPPGGSRGGGPPPPPGGGPPPPPGKPSNVPTAAHKVVSANVPTPGGGPPKPKGRTRAKTMLMSPKQAPVGMAGPPSKPKPPAPKPKPKPKAASYEAPSSGSDFDWDDDELETRLFDEPPAGGAEASQSSGPAPRAAAMPIATGAPPPAAASGSMPATPPAPAPASAQLPQPGAARPPGPMASPMGGVSSPSMSGPAMSSPSMSQPMSSPSMSQPMPQPMAAPSMSAPVMAAPIDDEPRRGTPIWVWLVAAIVGVGLIVGIALLLTRDKGGEAVADAGTGSTAGTGAAAAAAGSVSLALSPADAVVKVDGTEIAGSGSPRVLPDISAGSHKIEVIKDGDFLPFTQDVTVTAGQALPLDVKLQLAKVTITVNSDPASTKVTLVGGEKNVDLGSGASVKHNLTRQAGVSYKLHGEAKGYLPADVPLVFDGQAAQSFALSLVPDPDAKPTKKVTKKKVGTKKVAKAKTAELRIGVAPGNPPADVYVDGRKQSKKTPVFVKVSPGSHTVKWVWGSASSTQKVSIGDGESKTLKGKR